MTSGVLQRRVTRLLETRCRLLWGFQPTLIPCIVHDKGALRALVWFATGMARYKRTLRVLGPIRTHLACMAISLHNGCVCCSYGHAYALELHYLRETGRLFPLDARLLSGWLHLTPQALSARLHAVLREAGLHAEELWVDRTLALAAGELQPIDDTERRLANLVGMYSELNRIGIAGGTTPDEAHDPINMDGSLKARHSALRLAEPLG
jgi:hypothetical protein